MTREEFEKAVELNRSLKGLKSISRYLNRPYKEEKLFLWTKRIGGEGLIMPDILESEFILAVSRCIEKIEKEIEEL